MAHKKILANVKAEPVRLVVEVGCTPPQAARMMGLGPTAVRRRVIQASGRAPWDARGRTNPRLDRHVIRTAQGRDRSRHRASRSLAFTERHPMSKRNMGMSMGREISGHKKARK